MAVEPPAGVASVEHSFTESILQATETLRGVAVVTPVLTSESLNQVLGTRLWMKAESRQRTGSFKFRGAYNAVAALTAEARFRGLVTVSSGNHARALALAGMLSDCRVDVFMPSDAPRVKVAEVSRLGAVIHYFDRYDIPQEELASRLAESGPTYVSAHDDLQVIAGAATAGVELLAAVPDLEALVIPVGGGGCLAGTGLAARASGSDLGCRLIGVEPVGASLARSLATGSRISGPVPRTIADGLTLSGPGRVTFPILRAVVDEVVQVQDDEIQTAVELLEQHCGEVVEPSGAAGVAAVLAGLVGGRRIGTILTGGNRDPVVGIATL